MTVDENRPIFWDVEEDGDEDREGEGEGKKGVVRCSFRTINKGTWKEDLLVHKASGKRFVFVGVIDLVVEKESGLIRGLEEWYTNNRFDTMEEGEAGYNVMRS